MDITVRLTLAEDFNAATLQQWLVMGRELDAGLPSTVAYAVGDTSKTVTSFAGAHPLGEGRQMELPLTDVDDESNPIGPVGVVPPGVAQSGKPKSSRGGRRANAATAEAQAAAMQGAGTAPETQQAPVSPPSTAPAGFAVPPGVVRQEPQAVPATTTTATEPQAAMPKTEPPTAAQNVDGVMSLEDYKAEALSVFNAAKERNMTRAYPFNVMRQADVWPDGSPKAWATMNADSVPPDQRRLVLEHCMLLLQQ